MGIEELERRDGSTTNTRRSTHRSSTVLLKGHLTGSRAYHDTDPTGPGLLDKFWGPTSTTEFWTVPNNVTELLVSGMGGQSYHPGAYPNDSFGTFLIPVVPGEQLTIMVGVGASTDAGGWPDGGNGDPTPTAGGVAAGGAGSTRLKRDETTLFVAPGVGGAPVFRFGYSSDWRAVWRQGGADSDADFIGSDPNDWPFRLPQVPVDIKDVFYEEWFRIDDYILGGAASDGHGGAGSPPLPAYAGAHGGSGGGGGGWAGGAGGTAFTSHTEQTQDGVTDNYAYRHRSTPGLAGQPYAAPGSTWTGPPMEKDLRADVLIGPHLYVRWEE